MTVDKRVSVDGLTRCTRCRRHVHASATPSKTSCPFCDRKAQGGRRGGLLAASLFAMACGGSTPQAEEPTNEPVIEQPTPAPEPAPQPEPQPEPEPEPQPEPEASNPDPEPEDPDRFEDPVERPGVVALYGIAPKRKK
ncbi:MAG: hypothetical protein AB8H86_04270 [Polyangiales bacterium]